MTDLEYLPRIETIIKTFVPGYSVVSKASSPFMRALGTFLGIFGMTEFMSQFWTTIGYTTYCPPEQPSTQWIVIAHEGRHAMQSQRLTRVVMGLLYLIPLTLCPIFLLSIFFASALVPKIILGVLAALCLAPVPAVGRMLLEIDAYSVTTICNYWRFGLEGTQLSIESIIPCFTGSSYYFMWPFTGYLYRRLNAAMSSAADLTALSDPYLQAIYSDLKSQGMLRLGRW